MVPEEPPPPSLFLREDALRRCAMLVLCAERALADLAAPALEATGLGRAHRRALLLIGSAPGMSVSELQHRLRISKQSLARVLRDLTTRGLVVQQPAEADRRRHLLGLTPEGDRLERALFAAMRERIAKACRAAGPEAVEGFRKVLAALAGEEG